MRLPPGLVAPAVHPFPCLPQRRVVTVTFAAIEEARRCIAGAVAVTPCIASPSLSRRPGPGSAQAGEPPAHRLVQVPRCPGQARRPGRSSAAAASSPCRPATTPRVSPTMASAWAFRPRSSCRASRRRPRSRAPASTVLGSSCTARVRGRHRPRPPARAGGGARLRPPLRRSAIIAGQGTVGLELLDAVRISTCWWCRSVAAA